jgi:hypothetical protein
MLDQLDPFEQAIFFAIKYLHHLPSTRKREKNPKKKREKIPK